MSSKTVSTFCMSCAPSLSLQLQLPEFQDYQNLLSLACSGEHSLTRLQPLPQLRTPVFYYNLNLPEDDENSGASDGLRRRELKGLHDELKVEGIQEISGTFILCA
ncbi:hypothetical protein GQ43DRAFT_429726 [Delitschia confertaspora ATCC 74209]|uniref:Uncharacterized protein n=1 Tax=Delitschia confertaspora ATCC 74209 TaxID=1513339 RepID=A0A9P4JW35_9PLEO|nr:hypothetical protein GQ43DRAFT_429726 [Delitschia confertaspora ATCC 74209]